MSNLSSSGSRKKPRAKENKTPSVRERQRSSVLLQSALMPAIVESAGVISSPDAPYVCSGKFVVDFLQLCRRSALSYVPNVVARPRRPSAPASLGDEKRSTGFTSKQGSKLPSIQTAALYAAADQALTSDAVEVFIPEPPPRTYLLRDPISFFRPSVQVYTSFLFSSSYTSTTSNGQQYKMLMRASFRPLSVPHRFVCV